MNQVLAYHRVSPRVYDLAALRTGSIRDQLLRSHTVVESLINEGIISSDKPLLVFGAGAAGINAALTAATSGVSVVIVERYKNPFATFYHASFRRIDPVEFDWPHEHFHFGIYPAPGSSHKKQLVQMGGTAALLARAWRKEWADWIANNNGVAPNGKIDVIQKNAKKFCNNIIDQGLSGGVHVTGPWVDAQAEFGQLYGAVISCLGFGKERTFDKGAPLWNDYRGPSFWRDDDGITRKGIALSFNRVVISGGGDGGMQDFQRLMTGEFGKELLKSLIFAIDASGAPKLDGSLYKNLLLAEDKGRRAFAWHSLTGSFERTMIEWHKNYTTEVDKYLKRLDDKQLQDIARVIFRPEVINGKLSAYWVHRDKTPGFGYGLNRFLTLMLELLIQNRHVRALAGFAALIDINIMPEYAIKNIAPSSPHRCGDFNVCRNLGHNVRLENLEGDNKQITSDLVIIRHGAIPKPLLYGRAPVPEQMTPYSDPN
jgi:hypothetical protein